jgi:hypothetical protein
VVVRYNGGANAGHSVVIAGQRYALHLIPAGILSKGTLAVIGNGVVLDPDTLLKELDTLQSRGVDTSGLVISANAHVVMPYHKDEDAAREDTLKSGAGESPLTEIGTTRRGIGPAYADKVQRAAAVRARDLLRPELLRARIAQACRFKAPILGKQPDVEAMFATATQWGKRLAPMIRETTYLVHDQLRAGKRVMFEGANGTLLDVDHGTFPYVTGSNTGTAGIATGTGVPPTIADRRDPGVMQGLLQPRGRRPLAHRAAPATPPIASASAGENTARPPDVPGASAGLTLSRCATPSCSTESRRSRSCMLDVLAGFDDDPGVRTAYELADGSNDRSLRRPTAHELARVDGGLRANCLASVDEITVRPLAERRSPKRRACLRGDFIEDARSVSRSAFVSVGP